VISPNDVWQFVLLPTKLSNLDPTIYRAIDMPATVKTLKICLIEWSFN